MRTADGKVYYHNTLTNLSSWERPPDFVDSSALAAPGAGIPIPIVPLPLPAKNAYNIPAVTQIVIPPAPGVPLHVENIPVHKEEDSKKNTVEVKIEHDPLLQVPLGGKLDYKDADEAKNAFTELLKSSVIFLNIY
jgi:hypothetical protein